MCSAAAVEGLDCTRSWRPTVDVSDKTATEEYLRLDILNKFVSGGLVSNGHGHAATSIGGRHVDMPRGAQSPGAGKGLIPPSSGMRHSSGSDDATI